MDEALSRQLDELRSFTFQQLYDKHTEILLVTGIANPRPLKKLLEDYSNSYQMLQFSDHHIFTIDDLKDIKQKFENIKIS